ncbi:MAG: 2-oxoglutarate dehydrogenase E1 component [Bacteroidales bacterium]|nr:2-oxoglutarate dehydrogenase E1 component [Bacteroidales bacterium]
MDDYSYIGNSEINSIEQLYQQYQQNPDSLDKSWQHFFKGFEFARLNYDEHAVHSRNLDKEFKVLNYIDAFRKRGHLFTLTNPVRARRKYAPTLDPGNFGLSDDDLNIIFHAGTEIGIGDATLYRIREHLMETYCASIGSEYMHIRAPEKIQWLKHRLESARNKTIFSPEEKKDLYTHLIKAVGFENFLHRKFTGQKRFSLEGTETLIPALYHLIEKGSELGVESFFLGMAHRGRLNVLANVAGKPYEQIFQEFTAEGFEKGIALGDVKYHLGYCNQIVLRNGMKVSVNIAPNPSHLEAVSPVIQGLARATIDHSFMGDFTRAVPVLIHGDAALAGQGVVYEVLQMSELNGYKTGGTIHIVINNQVGFTTHYLDARSSTYCTDVGKVIKAPVFHVNGDDVEALVHAVRMAVDYRQTFFSDVFIDVLSYRKYGHNEGDEPRYTQPTLYKAIARHPNPRDIYMKQIVSQGTLTYDEAIHQQKSFDSFLEEKFEVSKTLGKLSIQRFLSEIWKPYRHADRQDFNKHFRNNITIELIQFIGKKINELPEDRRFIDKTLKLVENRRLMLKEGKADWALAELLAYGSLVYEGHPVRISGQDVVRGTFAHRHASHVIEDTDETYTPLKYINEKQAPFHIYNSPLNEYGVLGFEYGYALGVPQGLTVWEAQYGDFSNVAQVILDQYISSAEEKWGIMNGLVLFLPHGYEGQGPEHSSARIERFLILAARNNMQIVNPTTPSNLFHVLRQSVLRNFRVPLVVFTPKSLLRNPECISSLEELAEDHFREVIDDYDVDINEVRRLVLCSGKIYYELSDRKKKFKARDIALVRIEQLHPFPKSQVDAIMNKYKNVLVTLWVQEEPANMGPWRHILHEFKGYDILPVCRQPSGSPASGLLKIHQISQEEIIEKVFKKCVCELKRPYCGLQCRSGSQRQEVLNQYRYFGEQG